MNRNFELAANEAQQCKGSVETSNPDLINAVDAILIFWGEDPQAVQKMSIKRHMTETEKTQLLEYREKMLPCQSKFVEGLSSVHPEAVTYFSEIYANQTKNMVALVTDEITIGQYNSQRYTDIAKEQTEIIRMQQRINQQYAQAHNAEMESRQRAAAAMQTWSYQQQLLNQNRQLINAVNAPAITNCSYYGNRINCISH